MFLQSWHFRKRANSLSNMHQYLIIAKFIFQRKRPGHTVGLIIESQYQLNSGTIRLYVPFSLTLLPDTGFQIHFKSRFVIGSR